MSLNPLNHHYAMENPASVYDEEAMTALELAGRTTAKVNETVQAFNELEAQTNEHLENQDQTIDNRMNTQDQNITNIRTKTVPAEVKAECERIISAGEFDAAINLYLDNLNSRVDNILGAVTEGSTTLDAEVIDIRTSADGKSHENAGNAIRAMTKNIYPPISNNPNKVIPTAYTDNMVYTVENGVYHVEYTSDNTGAEAHVGCCVPLGKTQAQLAGKKLVAFLYGTTEDVPCYISSNPNSWQGAIRATFKDGLATLTATGTNLGENNLYFLIDFSRFKTLTPFTFDFVVYVVDDVQNGTNAVPFALFSAGAPTPERVNYANNADNAGWDYFNIKSFSHHASSNEGGVTLNGNEFTVNLLNGAKDSTFTYTVFSVNITQHTSQMRGIYVEADDTIDNMWLSGTIHSWQIKILQLHRGYNDITHIDFTQYPNVFVTAGITTTIVPPPDITGKIKVTFVTNGDVIATHFIGEGEFVKVKDLGQYDVNNPGIVCWGDSLTAGGGWTNTLSTLTGRAVYNAGTGGENVKTIMARQGADVMMVNNITIPAGTTPVQIATYGNPIKTAFGHNATPLLQGGEHHVNPVNIGGVLGNLKWTGSAHNDSTGVWTFTRLEAGDAITINRPTAMTTAYDREKNNPHLMVIFMGTNGGYTSNDDLVQLHRLMIDHANAKHTIILGMTRYNAETNAEYEDAMTKAFGRYFINLRDYLSTYGLADAGLTPTAEDTSAMNEGRVPPQLLSDGVHYTNKCKTVIGNYIYKRCCELNIF